MTPTDAVTLPVAEVRQAIYQAWLSSGGANQGRPRRATGSAATATLLGRMFHTAFANLRLHQVPPGEIRDAGALLQRVYAKSIGCDLTRYQAALGESTAQVLAFWEAVRSMCGWLAELAGTAIDSNLVSWDNVTDGWAGLDRLMATEEHITWELREPGWTAPVRVEGRADAVWRKPDGGWCVVEYKLGEGAEEADLAQACLYHEMLKAAGHRPGALALVRFQPQRTEQVFESEQLAEAQYELRQLIGRLAGVLPRAENAAPPQPAAAEGEPDLGDSLRRTLAEFGAPVRLAGAPVAGPTFVRFFLEPEKGVRPKRVLSHTIDLQVRLGLDAPPFLHVDQGRLVADVQRKNRQVVDFGRVAGQLPRGSTNSTVPLGVDLDGRLRFADLSSPVNAHILVAGSSGSGKSEWLRMAIAGLVATNTPASLRLVLIDPKRNAFGDLKSSPFLLDRSSLVYPPDDSAVETLDRLIEEMEARYRLFEPLASADLSSFIERTGKELPRIVCVCDEYADLIAAGRAARQQIEGRIARLGAKARAAGIHLILATQRPSRDIVAGVLKANLSCRVALKMLSPIESRIVIDRAGADQLLGHGDLLFLDIGEPVRLQAPLLSQEDRFRYFSAGASAAHGV